MGSDRLRVLALAIVALVMVVASAWVMDWFTVAFDGAFVSGTEVTSVSITIGLRDVSMCAGEVCESRSLSTISKGMYSTFAMLTLGSSGILAVLVALQGGLRSVTGQASALVVKLGYAAGFAGFAFGVAAAFLFNPELGEYAFRSNGIGVSLTVERTWAPHLLVLGIAVATFALHYAVHHAAPAVEPPLPVARALTSQNIRTVEPSQQIPAPRASFSRISTPIPKLDAAHAPLVGNLKYAMSQAEITRGGIDARREDRSNVLVMWRDVVGIVARRLPPSLESVAFADVVSSAGSTLRLVPWTRLSGDLIEGEGEPRVRAFIELVIARCPEVRVDRATRDFLDNKSPPAQLPDLETLAVHDSKLA